MIREKRQAMILERLRASGAASIHELAATLQVSGSTVRRDLKDLASHGYLRLSHGGAYMPHGHFSTFEMDAGLAAQVARAEKLAIGAAAAAGVADGERIIFDSSSTVLEAARAVAARVIRLVAITNDLAIAEAFHATAEVEVIMSGGSLRRGSTTLVGEACCRFLAGLHADVVFLGTHAISGRTLTETSLEVAAIKRAMIAAAARVVVLADGSKFQPPALCTICDARGIDTVITDAGAPPEAVAELEEAGVRVLKVRVPCSSAAGLNHPTGESGPALFGKRA